MNRVPCCVSKSFERNVYFGEFDHADVDLREDDSMRHLRPSRLLLAWMLTLLSVLSARVTTAQDPVPANDAKPVEAKPADKPVLAQFVTVEGTIDDSTVGRIRNTALKLQEQATLEDRKAILVLEVLPGSSELLQAMRVAKDLTANSISRVKTVAWVPQSLTGHNALVALGCKEIVMHPDASLGDIGLGKPVEPGERQGIIELIDKRYNPKLSRALVTGMLDPQAEVRVITIARGDDIEKRVVTKTEQQELINSGLEITDFETIKEPGEQGAFSASEARALGFLIQHTADSKDALAQTYGLPAEAMREDLILGKSPAVRLIHITETIDPVLEAFIERQIDRATSARANTIIFQIQSPGGYLLSGENLANRIIQLRDQKVRSIAFIPDHAYSAAAIVALACDEIYILPDARIGDAGPMEIKPGGQFERVPEKILSPLRQRLKSLGEEKGRPPALLEAMSDKDLDVYEVTHRDNGRRWYLSDDEIHRSNGEWIKGRVVPESENDLLLTVTGDRAVELKLATATVSDLADLQARLGLPEGTRLVGVERTWVDGMIFALASPAVAGLLLFLGIMFLYIEAHFFTGFFGILSVICFSIFFWSKFLGGTSGWLEVILFVLGTGMLLMEIFVIPGFGVFGITGILLVIGSLVMAFQTFGNYEVGGDWFNLLRTMGTLSGTLAAVIIMGAVISNMLPSIPFFNALILHPDTDSQQGGPRLRPDLSGEISTAAAGVGPHLVGLRGKSATLLRPAGKANIEGHIYDVVSEGGFISQDAEVEVLQVRGNRILVREIT
jgi:membrane-bound serine protease (ClpP class)